MSRLTKINEYGLGHKDCVLSCSYCTVHPCKKLLEIVEELVFYEDLREAGRLIILPPNMIVDDLKEYFSKLP